MAIRVLAAYLTLAVLAGCTSFSSVPLPADAGNAARASTRWIPTPGESYQIQYDGKLDLSVAADVYDLDMFDTPKSVVATLHAMGRRVVCYVDVGTWENWRPDAGKFPKSVLGKPDGHWRGERWLDVRQTAILEPIMAHRLELCKEKGFDGVDPDNLDGYQNKTGFPLTYQEQLTYDSWVAQAAHDRGLTADQKGDNGQVKDLVKVYDFAVVEQCYAQGWCQQFDLYTNTNRLVVDVEYYHDQQRFLNGNCAEAAKNHDTAILKKLELTAWLLTCPSSGLRPR
ncbi:MAG: endo alpha-1,4 polygalactosaminidase [Candidatus Baltobacteraceae bacterium]